MEIKVLDTNAKEVGVMEVPESVFGVDYNEPLIHQIVVAQLANKRQGTKSTLTRTEVRGGGAKPWRQKGTGRARQGSIRSPQWTHGGVVFAPKPRDFRKKINKKMKDAAMRSVLSQKLREGSFIVVDKFEIEAPKTKLVAAILDNLSVTKSALLLLKGNQSEIVRAGRNIPKLTTADAALANVYDIVRADKCIVTKEAVEAIAEVYAQ
ncbi:MAG: 50S ribosomal protein L4 [Clostridia bacterium]|nr:50S ribosomal protein L4 [Clostridia bacterium]